MLMDHSDPKLVGIVRIVNMYCLSIFSDLSLFRLIQTEENAHQS